MSKMSGNHGYASQTGMITSARASGCSLRKNCNTRPTREIGGKQ